MKSNLKYRSKILIYKNKNPTNNYCLKQCATVFSLSYLHCGRNIAELVFGARAPTSSLSSALGLPSSGQPSRFPDQICLEASELLVTRLRQGHFRVTSPEVTIRGLKVYS